MVDKETKTTDKPADDKLTAGEVRKMINDMVQESVTSVVSGLGLSKSDSKGDGNGDKDGDSGAKSSSGTPSFATGSVSEQVRREIEKIRSREARDAKDKEIDQRLSKIDKAMEKQPVERRWVHKLMGWGDND